MRNIVAEVPATLRNWFWLNLDRFHILKFHVRRLKHFNNIYLDISRQTNSYFHGKIGSFQRCFEAVLCLNATWRTTHELPLQWVSPNARFKVNEDRTQQTIKGDRFTEISSTILFATLKSYVNSALGRISNFTSAINSQREINWTWIHWQMNLAHSHCNPMCTQHTAHQLRVLMNVNEISDLTKN